MGSLPAVSHIINTIMQVLLVLSLLSCALSLPPPAPRLPYTYQYGVKDDVTKSNFAKTESQDANGQVKGTFVIALPDGRVQTTKYTADPVNGYVAKVSYQGEPVYPAQRPVNIFTAF